MPLPSTVVIPQGWSAHHRPVATGGQTATCSLAHPGATGGTFDPATGTRSGTPTVPYLTGAPCRVDAGSPEGANQPFGEQLATILTGTITVDFATSGSVVVKVDDLVSITAADDNASPTLVGRVFRVRGVAHSSLEWERILGVTDYEG